MNWLNLHVKKTKPNPDVQKKDENSFKIEYWKS